MPGLKDHYEQREEHQAELYMVLALLVIAVFFYGLAYVSISFLLSNIQHHNNFVPAETVQIISAVGGLSVAVGTSIAAIIKACALFFHARADFVRARNELPESSRLYLSTRETKPKKGRKSIGRRHSRLRGP